MKKIYFVFKNLIYLFKSIFFISKISFKYLKVLRSIKIIYKFFKHYLLTIFVLNIKHKKDKINFNILTTSLKFSNDWFSNNIPIWLFIFSKENQNKFNKILEIGSFEGMSSYFLLNHFVNSKIDCVETFLGSDEHKKK